MDPLKAHPTTYATHELEDARARIGRELSRRRAAQVADAAEDFPRLQSAYHRAKRDLFGDLYSGAPSAHVTVPQDGRPALATWDKLQAALKDAGVTVTQGAWRAPRTGDTHVSGPDLDVPDTPEGRKLWQAHQDQFQAEEAEEARQVAEHAPFQPHSVRRASDLKSGGAVLVCSCGKWEGPPAALAATVLNSYGAHLREVWGC